MLESLYTVSDFSLNPGYCKANVSLDQFHRVFDGHFEDRKILPAVVQLQIIHDLLNKAVGEKMEVIKVDSAKFISIIEPSKTPHFLVNLQWNADYEESLCLYANIEHGSQQFLKLKMYCKRARSN